jgi:hypothetical protein
VLELQPQLPVLLLGLGPGQEPGQELELLVQPLVQPQALHHHQLNYMPAFPTGKLAEEQLLLFSNANTSI